MYHQPNYYYVDTTLSTTVTQAATIGHLFVILLDLSLPVIPSYKRTVYFFKSNIV